MTRVMFPDVEAWAVGYLTGLLAERDEAFTDGVHVSNTVPDPRQARMVIVRRDGGPRLDVIRELARLGVRVWGSSDAEATDLANLVRALLDNAAGDGPVVRVDDSTGPSAVPDASGESIRYFTVPLIIRGQALS